MIGEDSDDEVDFSKMDSNKKVAWCYIKMYGGNSFRDSLNDGISIMKKTLKSIRYCFIENLQQFKKFYRFANFFIL